ncbi:MAG: hypothetical protein AABX13_00520 [Nanoarchaeota archaeon]
MIGVKAKCKNCGNEALADQFKLHHAFKMMVCPGCYTGKTKSAAEVGKGAEEERGGEGARTGTGREMLGGAGRMSNKPAESSVPRPAGWDKEDEYLGRASRLRKQETQATFTKIEGTEFVKYVCQHCKYNFRYSPSKRIPATCPYCDYDIPRVKLSDLSPGF